MSTYHVNLYLIKRQINECFIKSWSIKNYSTTIASVIKVIKVLLLKRIRQATYSSQIDSKPVLWDKFIVCVIFLHFHIFRRRINREKVEILKTRYCWIFQYYILAVSNSFQSGLKTFDAEVTTLLIHFVSDCGFLTLFLPSLLMFLLISIHERSFYK